MTKRLQMYDHKSSTYERPGRKWVCGHAEEGNACRRGPNSSGQCRTKSECRPFLDGDRWVCTRPESAGGPCTDGPLPDGTCARPVPPCVPVRSLRSQRFRTAQLVVAATLGFLFIAVGGASWWWLSPGPVARAHAEVGSCGECHSAFDMGVAAWVSASVGGADVNLESGRCMVCHDVGRDALLAHSMPVEAMEAHSKAIDSEPATEIPNLMLEQLISGQDLSKEQIPCATCHREHHGRDSDLTKMADSRCQTCHQLTFRSFSDGHPSFEDYPSSRRPHVMFDHARHFNRHFQKAEVKPPSACGSCHVTDVFGRNMVVRSFDDTCASCHVGQINGTDRMAGSKAIAVFRVPGVDAQTLSERGFNIGEWPEFAEEEPTPFMKLLLSGDRQTRRDLQKFSELDDPLDLREASTEDLEAVTRVAWAVKELIYDVMMEGADAIAERLQATTGRSIDRDVLLELVGALPRDVMASAQQDWFPNLLTEVQQYRSGGISVEGAAVPLTESAVESSAQIDAQPGGPDSDVAEDLVAADSGDDLLVDDDLLSGGDDLLADDDLLMTDDLLSGDDDDILGDDELWQAEDEIFDLSSPEVEAEPLPELPAINPEEWASLGGWYRSDYSLYYRPLGHADPFMGGWLEMLSRTFGTRHERTARPLFKSLTDPLAPGSCTKCHRIDRNMAGNLQVSWSPNRQPRPEKDFTVFSHVSHFSLPGGAECVSCHKPRPVEAADPQALEDAPEILRSNFLDIEKQQCVSCHVEDGAGDSCTICHGYHVGISKTRLRGTEIDAL